MHLFVDNFTNIDFSYLDIRRGLVGETWLVSITLEGLLDDQGMVCDFGTVKKTVRDWLDTYIDHCLVVPGQATGLHKEQTEHCSYINWLYQDSHNKDKRLHCNSPKQAITFIDSDTVTPESMANWCIQQLSLLLTDTIHKVKLSFAPERIEHAFYHYSHGLKKHVGNCQRIAHGHRSTIAITENGKRNHELETQWCAQWQDIYIGSQEDLTATTRNEGVEYYHFTYQARQGDFELMVAAEDCYLINTDTTVELIAQHIADTLGEQYPDREFVVKAYEGIGKGAVATNR
ncbi:hypothetical protein AB835_02110 [Candidatus Endobugula sertula]|uniref:6-carboxy-5,6,7,8-tetrahydropterin synthase n=1 Tax=Candidatus Endobugula sertula TaxID=62101 RepID=A0A1D2QT42_9GAMM|nr:hypothetical protein AB835_02110 [Candidatus Endobugula sertula]